MNITVEIGKLKLKNPILTASVHLATDKNLKISLTHQYWEP